MIISQNILGSFEVSKRALQSHQAAMNTVAHNLANAATPGYTRQRAELAPVAPMNGVEVAAIRRIRDRYLDFALLAEAQTQGKLAAQESLLGRLEGIFNAAPGTGLSAAMDQFFNGFQDLSVNPTDPVLRVAVRDQGQQLVATMQGLQGRIQQLKDDLTRQIQEKVTEANGLLSEIGELHRQILGSGGRPTPNDLLDRRDQLVTQLGQIIGVSASDRPDGTVQLVAAGGGVMLVDGAITTPLTATINGSTDSVDLTVGGLALTPSSGGLAAVLDARNSATGAVKQAATDLDALARTLIGEVNRLHAGGSGIREHSALTAQNAVSSAAVPLTAAGLAYTPTSGSFTVRVHDAAGALVSTVTVAVTAGVTTLENVRAALDADAELRATIASGKLTITANSGRTFAFGGDSSDTLMALGLNTFFTGSDARTMTVDPTIVADVSKIAGALVDSSGLVHAGDGSNALALARLRTKLVLGSGTQTFGDAFGALLGRVGSQTRQAKDAVERQAAAVQALQALQQQTSGVSTDEELISLSESQTAYAAAARHISTMREVIQSLLDAVR